MLPRLLILLAGCFLFSCQSPENTQTPAKIIDGIPEFMLQGNIYEVNVRQYTPEGTFKAFAEHLPRLKEMGVQTLWFMPVTPISVAERKGTLGSYIQRAGRTALRQPELLL